MKIGSSHEHKRKLDWFLLINLVVLFSMAAPVSADIIPSARRITWQGKVGVPGGIPDRTTICGTANASNYGNDSTDARSHIQGLLNSCGSGEVVYLPAGTYRISGALNIPSGRVLRGAGPNNTTIRFTGSSGNMITFGSGSYSSTVSITGGANKGSTSITLSNASGKDVGDLLLLDQLNSGESFVTSSGTNGNCTWCGRDSGTRSMSQISIITAKNGNTVSIDPPMQWTYTASPEASEITNVSTNSGLEDLKLYNSPGNAGTTFTMIANKYSWIKNIEIERVEGVQTGTSCFHGTVSYGFRNEIRDSYFLNNNQYFSNSYGIQVVRSSTNILVENNIFKNAKVYVYLGWGSTSMVAGYNYVYDVTNGWDDFTGDIQAHGAHPKMMLLEGNYLQKSKFDIVWGSSSHNTIFRNWIRATQPPGSVTLIQERSPIQLYEYNRYFNIVGNVLGDPSTSWAYESGCSGGTIYTLGYRNLGCGGTRDSQVRGTLLRHGNFDYSANSTKWCDDSGEPGCQGGDASRTIPDSLYLSGRPSWWCDELPWPPIGPDLSPMVSDIPAKRRYNGEICTTSGTPPPPPDLEPAPPTIISIE